MTYPLPVLLLAVLVPWLFGSLLARWLSGPGRSAFLYLGQGYILGMLAVVWLTRTWQAAGWSLKFWPMAGLFLLLSILAGAGLLIDNKRHNSNPTSRPGQSSYLWQQVLVVLLFIAMGAHLLTVAQELLLRPTFPWDAWRGWEPKVIQLFDSRSLKAPIKTIGNHGEISTLALLWMMLASEATHEPFLHLPWLAAYMALAAMVFGYLCDHHSSPVAAMGAYLVLSLPYLNIHVALAGYADIWLSLAFTAGVLALSDLRRNNRLGALAVALLMTVACFQAKRAGIGFAAVLSTLLIVEASLRAPRPVGVAVAVMSAVAAGAVALAIMGYQDIQLLLPGGQEFVVNAKEARLPGLFLYTFAPEWQPGPFLEALLGFGNWHLTAYLWLGAAALVLAFRRWQLLLQPENLGVLIGLAVIALYFVLVSPGTALDHTGLSRAVLYVLPLALVWLLTVTQKLAGKVPRNRD